MMWFVEAGLNIVREHLSYSFMLEDGGRPLYLQRLSTGLRLLGPPRRHGEI